MPDRRTRRNLHPTTEARWGDIARQYVVGFGSLPAWRDNPALRGDAGRYLDVSIGRYDTENPFTEVRAHHLGANPRTGEYVPPSGLVDATLTFEEARAMSVGPLLSLLVYLGLSRAVPVRLDLGGAGEWVATWSGGRSWILHRGGISANGTMGVAPHSFIEALRDPPGMATDEELFGTWRARNELRTLATIARARADRSVNRLHDVDGIVERLEVQIVEAYRAGARAEEQAQQERRETAQRAAEAVRAEAPSSDCVETSTDDPADPEPDIEVNDPKGRSRRIRAGR